MKEIEEALIILRERKQRQAPNFDFLQKVDDEKGQSKKRINDYVLSEIFYRFKSTST